MEHFWGRKEFCRWICFRECQRGSEYSPDRIGKPVWPKFNAQKNICCVLQAVGNRKKSGQAKKHFRTDWFSKLSFNGGTMGIMSTNVFNKFVPSVESQLISPLLVFGGISTWIFGSAIQSSGNFAYGKRPTEYLKANFWICLLDGILFPAEVKENAAVFAAKV